MKSESAAVPDVIETLSVGLAPRLAVLGAVLLWGASFSAMRAALADLHPWSVMWLRMVVALACDQAATGFLRRSSAQRRGPSTASSAIA